MGVCGRVLIALIIVIGAARELTAHAELLSSTPAAESVSAISPSSISITFSEAVETSSQAIRLFGPDGLAVPIDGAVRANDDPRTIRAALRSLNTGTYTVQWRVLSEDGHAINGTYRFSVGAAGAATAPAEDSPAPRVAWSVGARAFHLIALSVLLGPLTFLLLVRPPHPTMRQRLWTVMLWGSVALLPAAALMFLAQSEAVSGSIDAAVRPESAYRLVDTQWGRLWVMRAGWAAVSFMIACLGYRFSRANPDGHHTIAALALAVGGSAVATATAMNGHAATTDPIWMSISIDWLHVMATTAWIGGLAALVAAVFPVIRSMPPADRDGALAPVAARFSMLALVCVEVLVLTGLYQSWVHVDSPASLTATAYGRALLLKLAILAVMMLPAAINLLVIRPRLNRLPSSGELYRNFRWTVGAELVLGAAVLVVVGGLTSMAPARVEAAARRTPSSEAGSTPVTQGLAMADHVGTTLVLFEVSPVRLGPNQLSVQLQDSAGAAARGVARFRIVPPADSGVSPWTVMPVVSGVTHRATALLAPEGRWTVEVSTGNSEEAAPPAVFAFDVPSRGAHDLLVASAGRMNRLQSATERIEILADGAASLATVSYRAPDRERWTNQSSNEATEITVGDRRFTRDQNGRWLSQMVSHFHWPHFEVHPATDPVLVAREVVDQTDCFVIAYVNPADRSHHRAWLATNDLRMLRHSEAAPGRFVVSHYSAFDVPVQIEAPRASR